MDGTIKKLKECQPGKRLQDAFRKLIGRWLLMDKNASNCEITQPAGGLWGAVVAFRHPLELSQSV